MGARADHRGDNNPIDGQDAAAVSIIVPAYREAENLRPLAQRLAQALAGRDWELLVVDDDSCDGSIETVTQLARTIPVRIEVRTRPPRDLSLAVLHGMRCARHDRLVVMDADLSHPPERVPDLLAALDGGAGMAVGSRYVPGGQTAAAWGAWRRINSRLATLLARPLVACADPMAGFFAVDRRSLPDLHELRPLGFKIGLELMVRGRLATIELPIAFQDRARGRSKMGWRQQLAFLRHLQRLYLVRFGTPARVASFLAVGGSGFVVDVAVYLGLQGLGLEHRLARFISFWPAVTWNWRLNRALTFEERPRSPVVRQWTQFAVGSLLGLGVNVGGYTALTTFVAVFDRHRLLALICGVALGSAVNYLVATRFAYRRAPGVRAIDME